jgi:aspartate carbamoyltransferase catalytic subunit
MALEGRDLISISDFSDRELEAVFDLADEMSQHTRGGLGLADGLIMCTLFYEPSTRTRLSFEAAMQRLGGGVLSVADTAITSVAKGETIADTVRIIESYADLIVIRNPYEGSAKVAADFASVPVVNAGDGAHEHPTQTLLDLYTIRREKGKIKDLHVALVGDLRYGRTVHSLAFGLARFGAKVTLVAPEGLELPAHLLARLESEFAMHPARYQSLEQIVTNQETTGRRPGRQRALAAEVLSLFDVVYVTRIQKERFESEEAYLRAKSTYGITAEVIGKARTDLLVMHPLPRVDELAYALDRDPRAVYFRQAAYGLPIRMALVAALLGRRTTPVHKARPGDYKPEPRHEVDFRKLAPVHCPNPRCITVHEGYLTAQFYFVGHAPNTIACAYCEHEMPAPTGLEART